MRKPSVFSKFLIALFLVCSAPLVCQSQVALAQTTSVQSTDIAPAQNTTEDCPNQKKGWHFYCDPPVAPVLKPPPAAVAPAPTKPARNPKLVAAEKFTQELKDAMAIAVYEPTPENVLAWARMKHQLVVKSDTMAEVHQNVMWQNPELDFTVVGRPTSQVGMQTYDDQLAAGRAQSAAALAKTHVLYYFARSDCPFCIKFSPNLKAFAEATGLRVYAVSLDNKPITHFADALPDNGMSTKLNVFAVPAIFIADPLNGKVVSLGYGVLSDNDLFTRLDAFLKASKAAESSSAALALPAAPRGVSGAYKPSLPPMAR